ncbi:hypothetical protein HDU98_010386 [Podochytrium sp. JEL0797]|nr:hypothetical protein HDU98_010386 [Podochytrium sp. JEL0797]
MQLGLFAVLTTIASFAAAIDAPALNTCSKTSYPPLYHPGVTTEPLVQVTEGQVLNPVNKLFCSGTFLFVDGCTFTIKNFTFLNAYQSHWYGGVVGMVNGQIESNQNAVNMVAGFVPPSNGMDHTFNLITTPGASYSFFSINQLRLFDVLQHQLICTIDLPYNNPNIPGSGGDAPAASATTAGPAASKTATVSGGAAVATSTTTSGAMEIAAGFMSAVAGASYFAAVSSNVMKSHPNICGMCAQITCPQCSGRSVVAEIIDTCPSCDTTSLAVSLPSMGALLGSISNAQHAGLIRGASWELVTCPPTLGPGVSPVPTLFSSSSTTAIIDTTSASTTASSAILTSALGGSSTGNAPLSSVESLTPTTFSSPSSPSLSSSISSSATIAGTSSLTSEGAATVTAVTTSHPSGVPVNTSAGGGGGANDNGGSSGARRENSANSGSSASNLGPILGGVAAAVFLLLVVAFVLWLKARTAREQREQANMHIINRFGGGSTGGSIGNATLRRNASIPDMSMVAGATAASVASGAAGRPGSQAASDAALVAPGDHFLASSSAPGSMSRSEHYYPPNAFPQQQAMYAAAPPQMPQQFYPQGQPQLQAGEADYSLEWAEYFRQNPEEYQKYYGTSMPR